MIIECGKRVLKGRCYAIAVVLLLVASSAMAGVLPRHRKYEWSGLSLEDMKGRICVPVIFINFSETTNDNEIEVSEANQSAWMKRLNEGCAANHMGDNGSVNDYFRAQSYGQMEVTFERLGSFTANGKASDYAITAQSGPLARQAMVAQEGVDWSRYDSNGDKEVDCVLLIYAGHADGDLNSSGSEVKSIYPHMNWLSRVGGKPNLPGGYTAQNYVYADDLRDHANHVGAINSVCHELSHGIFDLCDYYRNLTSYMGQWDPMCFGYRQTTYGNADNHCCEYGAFDRMYLGWLTPRELTASEHVTLQPISRQGDACILFDPEDEQHFFLMEARAKLSKTWDYHLPASGLLVTEVHFDRKAFESHGLNGKSVPHIQVINASTGKGLAIHNSVYYNVSQKGVPYGPDGRTEICSEVSPLFEKMQVRNISLNADGSVEFDFINASTDGIGTPEQPLPNGRSYDLSGRQVKGEPQGIVIRNGRKVSLGKTR